MDCTGKMVQVGSWRVGKFSMVKLKKKSLSRGSFRTHGRVIGNKTFFIFGLKCNQSNRSMLNENHNYKRNIMYW